MSCFAPWVHGRDAAPSSRGPTGFAGLWLSPSLCVIFPFPPLEAFLAPGVAVRPSRSAGGTWLLVPCPGRGAEPGGAAICHRRMLLRWVLPCSPSAGPQQAAGRLAPSLCREKWGVRQELGSLWAPEVGREQGCRVGPLCQAAMLSQLSAASSCGQAAVPSGVVRVKSCPARTEIRVYQATAHFAAICARHACEGPSGRRCLAFLSPSRALAAGAGMCCRPP